MKKIMYLFMMFVMLAMSFADISDPLFLVSDSDVNGFNVVAISATVTPTFMQMSGRLKNVMTGEYVNTTMPVEFYCYKNNTSLYMNTVYTNEDGVFDFGPESLVSGTCSFGDDFYIVVKENDETYKSEKIKLIGFSQSPGSSSRNGNNENENQITGGETEVPEFSTITFGLAMLIAGMGFVLLRKN